MSITVVLQQMIIIMILILTGMFLYRRKMLSEDTSRQLSGLIVNITNPALLICSAFDDTPKVPLSTLGIGACVFFISYILLIAAAYLIPLLLKVPKAPCRPVILQLPSIPTEWEEYAKIYYGA